eukprot:98566-Chlamydomonas_euryale.AAC.4
MRARAYLSVGRGQLRVTQRRCVAAGAPAHPPAAFSSWFQAASMWHGQGTEHNYCAVLSGCAQDCSIYHGNGRIITTFSSVTLDELQLTEHMRVVLSPGRQQQQGLTSEVNPTRGINRTRD